MKFEEFGNKNGKKLLMLPGTACTWQLNFQNVIDALAEKYYLICVNYDGFEGSSDLDQGNKIFAKILTIIFVPMLSGACKWEKSINKDIYNILRIQIFMNLI